MTKYTIFLGQGDFTIVNLSVLPKSAYLMFSPQGFTQYRLSPFYHIHSRNKILRKEENYVRFAHRSTHTA